MKAWRVESKSLRSAWVIAAPDRSRAMMSQVSSAIEYGGAPSVRWALDDLRITRAPHFDAVAARTNWIGRIIDQPEVPA